MIDSVNSVHVALNGVDVYKRSDQILVSGIIGWPANDDPSTVKFTIGVDTTSIPAPQNTYWDYMPICTIPSQKSADGNIYRAYGGLRLKKFIDAYRKSNLPADQNTFSICNSDFTNAMTQIGNAIVKVLKPGCVNYPLIDADPNWPGVQPECQVLDRKSCDQPNVGNCLSSGYSESRLLECMDAGHPLDATTPNLNAIPDSARPCWYLTYDKTAAGCASAPNGQRILALRPSGTVAPAGTMLAMKCLTCAKPPGETCPALGTQ
jgi:hypothetical protein